MPKLPSKKTKDSVEDTLRKECTSEKEFRMVLKQWRKVKSKTKKKINRLTLVDIMKSGLDSHRKYIMVAEYMKLYRLDTSLAKEYEKDITLYNKFVDLVCGPEDADDDHDHDVDACEGTCEDVRDPRDADGIISVLDTLVMPERTRKDLYAHVNGTKAKSISREVWEQKMNWYTSLPYQTTKWPVVPKDAMVEFCMDLKFKLDTYIHGLDEAKESIILYVYSRLINPNYHEILCLSGPPGRGKTALAHALGKALGIPSSTISFGGLTDAATFTGSNSVYGGSQPSIILHKLREMKCADGIIIGDEIDKIGADSDKRSVHIGRILLHIFDPLTNFASSDEYLNEIPHDFSKIFWILTMNDESELEAPLRDRMHIIHIPEYSEKEEHYILIHRIMPDILSMYSMKPIECILTPEGCKYLRTLCPERSFRQYRSILTKLIKKFQWIHMQRQTDTPVNPKYAFIPPFPCVLTANLLEDCVKAMNIGSSSQYKDAPFGVYL